MREYRIAVIPGDGIGKEVVPAAVKVLELASQIDNGFRLHFDYFPWGCEYYSTEGEMMPKDGLRILEGYEAIYLGAIGFPSVPDHISLWGLLLPIRKSFNQYVNLRPIKLLPGVRGPLRDKGPEDIDFICVRENTEGEYAGVGGRVHVGTPYEVAIQTNVFTRHAVERVIRYAFELAKGRPKKRVTSVTKSNACQYSMVFWDEVFQEVSQEYGEITTEKWHIDAMAARFVTKPESLDVVVASNLFADILTDLGGALQGSLGLAASANLNPERRYPSMFEPVHGSAPDIAGKGIANPIATIWSGAMMLEFLGEKAMSEVVMRALMAVTGKGKCLTPDLGGSASTAEVASEVQHQIQRLAS
ncbi:MAG: tartrate dehydrogenase [Chloroflexi bacterium]|nr:tartrate dehydrogenase [Chloroflexota bacterium]